MRKRIVNVPKIEWEEVSPNLLYKGTSSFAGFTSIYKVTRTLGGKYLLQYSGGTKVFNTLKGAQLFAERSEQ